MQGNTSEGAIAPAKNDREGSGIPTLRIAPTSDSSVDMLRGWNFLTSHARVLLAVALDPDATIDEIARTVILSRRSVFRILEDLQDAGYVRRIRSGRKNRYEVDRKLPLGDPLVEGEPVSKLVENLTTVAVVRRAGAARQVADGDIAQGSPEQTDILI